MQLDGSAGIERCRELKFVGRSYRVAIERCPQQSDLDGLRTIEICQAYRNFLDGLRSCRDCLKTVFQEEKNTNMNAIKHAIQLKIQTTF